MQKVYFPLNLDHATPLIVRLAFAENLDYLWNLPFLAALFMASEFQRSGGKVWSFPPT